MSNLKCPFCNLDIRTHRIFVDGCDNTHSPLWQKLMRTRKALDVATKYIKHTQKVSPFWFNRLANETLDKIKTALEQKD